MKESTNPTAMPVTAVIRKSDNPETPITPSTLYVDESSIRNVEEPITTLIVMSIFVDNLDDSLVIFRHPDPRVKFGYLGINDRSEEAKSSMVYGKIDERIAQIMLDSNCNIYILSTDFANAGNIPCFPCKLVPVELVV